MQKNKPKFNWIIAAILFIAFLLSFWLDLTGVELHQWLGVTLSALAAYHLVTHLDWVEAVTRRFFRRTSNQARLFYLLDWVLLISFALIVETGLIISTWLNLSLDSYPLWVDVHVAISLISLALLVLKIGLHARWIIKTARKYFARPTWLHFPTRTSQPHAAGPSLAAVPLRSDRREFLKLMGLVGAGALVSAVSVLDVFSGNAAETAVTVQGRAAGGHIPAGQATPTVENQTVSDPETAVATVEPTAAPIWQEPAVVSQNNPSGGCSAVCDRGCSYPGQCRRYRDNNGNGLCDLGECA